jgi:hypothetical protein
MCELCTAYKQGKKRRPILDTEKAHDEHYKQLGFAVLLQATKDVQAQHTHFSKHDMRGMMIWCDMIGVNAELFCEKFQKKLEGIPKKRQ